MSESSPAALPSRAPVSSGSLTLEQRFHEIRALTERLCEPLEVEDHLLQAMPDASPPKWNLGHTSWFFETFVLLPHAAAYREFHPRFGYLFNSYYEAVGERQPRPRRGDLSRPPLREVMSYRHYVDEHVARLLGGAAPPLRERLAPLIELGLHHEQQHQELLLTDVKYNFSVNVLEPAYREREAAPTPAAGSALPARWVSFPGGDAEVGFAGPGFCFDNETPRHRTWLAPYQLQSRLVTCGEYLEFIEDGGYDRTSLWLSDGWAWRQQAGVEAPLYWRRDQGGWTLFTLEGRRPVDPAEPVCHVSLYEADAFATWAGARLPTEAEWEDAAGQAEIPPTANLLEEDCLHPRALREEAASGPAQMFGDVWEWTGSAYLPYPGYRQPSGALGEYNGKFMVNQRVLRGGSCATPRSHLRPTYRNFFYPQQRWQFMGLRLARHG